MTSKGNTHVLIGAILLWCVVSLWLYLDLNKTKSAFETELRNLDQEHPPEWLVKGIRDLSKHTGVEVEIPEKMFPGDQ